MWRWDKIDECPPAHCCAVQMAFERMVEQPTERSPTWDCKQARTRPPPGLTSAHRERTSVAQSRSEVNNPCCAFALRVSVSSSAAPSAIVVTPSAIIEGDFNIIAFLCVIPHPARRSTRPGRSFSSFWPRSLTGEQRLLTDASQKSRLRRNRIDISHQPNADPKDTQLSQNKIYKRRKRNAGLHD